MSNSLAIYTQMEAMTLAAVVGVGADELELQIDDEIIVIRRPTDTELDATGGSHDR